MASSVRRISTIWNHLSQRQHIYSTSNSKALLENSFPSCRQSEKFFCRSFQATGAMADDKTLFGESFVDVSASGDQIINCVQGAPGIRHLNSASEIMKKSTEHLLSLPTTVKDNYILQYGPRLGSTRARQAIASFLSEGYGDDVKGDSIVVTGGATNGLQMVATHFFKDGDIVFVEDPTYFIATHMLKTDLKMKLVPVPTGEFGIDLDAYEKLLEEHYGSAAASVTPERPFRGMVYLIPTYNNPRGFCIPPENCKRLVKLARKYEILNFCDDVYNLLHFDADSRAPPRFLTYDSPSDPDFKGHTISNGTFSKILAPGLRLGWVETSTRLVQALRKSNILWSAGCTNHYTGEVVSSAIELGLQQAHLRQLNAEYKEKIKNTVDELRKNFPAGVKVNHIVGGYFFWIELPPNAIGADVAKLAMEKYHVRVLPGASCSPLGNYQNCLRMSISYQDEALLVEGARRVAAAITEYLKTSQL